MFRLYNTLTRKIEEFTPLNPPKVTMYCCGPTVYDYTHIGHLSKYIGDDLLRRSLTALDFQVHQVMNITDVGHLVSDGDEGEDKMEKGAHQSGRTVWEVAKFFEDYFFASTDQVNILRPDIVAKATEHVSKQIKLIEKLEKRGFTYQTREAIYFDISKFPDYTKLSGQSLTEKEIGSRVSVIVDQQKRHPQDFALWFFTVGKFEHHTMRWDSPWGIGFPGWHIECSAMSMEYLGETIDIHTGGIDHIPVHHSNEIAQSEGASGKQFVRFWVHHRFILVEGEKMSKSKKNFYTIDDIKAKGFEPLALRYLFMTAHYRDPINFTWKSLEAAQNALSNLRELVRSWEDGESQPGDYYQKFLKDIKNDLNIPQALALMWEMVKSDQPSNQKATNLLAMDKILGLNLDKYVGRKVEIPQKVQKLLHKREEARKKGDFKTSDEIRREIKKLGFEVEDTPSGSVVKSSSI